MEDEDFSDSYWAPYLKEGGSWTSDVVEEEILRQLPKAMNLANEFFFYLIPGETHIYLEKVHFDKILDHIYGLREDGIID